MLYTKFYLKIINADYDATSTILNYIQNREYRIGKLNEEFNPNSIFVYSSISDGIRYQVSQE